MPDTPAPGSPVPPRTLRAAAALVGLQGAGLLALAAFFAVEIALGAGTDLVGALGVLGAEVAAGALLLLVARGLLRGMRWARSPALLTQLLALPVAHGLTTGGRWPVGVPLAAWALTVLALLLAPATGAALEG